MLLAEEGPLAIPGLAHLRYVDVVGPDSPLELLHELQVVHARHFPEHDHVLGELAADRLGPGPYPGVRVHQWLILRDGRPVGCCLFHTNTRRAVVLVHFLAVDVAAQADLPSDWLGGFVRLVEQVGQVECAQAGTELLAIVGELDHDQLDIWRHVGFQQLGDLPYGQPVHGMHWAQFDDEPQFRPRTPTLRRTPAGQQVAFPRLVDTALQALLVDHYRLPPGNRRVSAIRRAVQALPDQ